MESDANSNPAIVEEPGPSRGVDSVDNMSVSQGIPHGIRVQDLWFEDGGVVVQAESCLYRVSRGILAARSSIFKGVFHSCAASTTGEGLEMMDGVPFLRLPDAERDVTHFFKAIFDSSYFAPYPGKTSFSIVASVLRLSHKYNVNFLQKRALRLAQWLS
ncbi:hypothetical protein APHAL10511_005098 [Amanita phalloides]|nr:hypothetical protein APHAL10511_005098 [Amanita phalloides]